MESYCSLCTLNTIHRLLFVTRLIINKIKKVQWVDFKLENVLVSLHVLNRTTLIILYCVLHDPCNIVCVCPVNNVYV
jgi:hypothetical protein